MLFEILALTSIITLHFENVYYIWHKCEQFISTLFKLESNSAGTNY